ncbi:hypothetical protein BGX26_000773 [Mortierella sp. AD094]|nr:hypothetical protein BGX26_000773 [Mortierella sp. AD094]
MTINSTSSSPASLPNEPQIPDVDIPSNQHILQNQRNQLHPIRTTPTSRPLHSNQASSTIVNFNDQTEYDVQSPDTASTQMTKSSLSDQPFLNSCKEKIETVSRYEAQPIQPEDMKAEEEDNIPHRHPPKVRGSIYTRLFQLDSPRTQSNVVVRSTWLSTGALFSVRFVMFLYTSTVLIADMCLTERIKFEFCFLTQLSYLGLTSYLGTVSWHTFSEWRRKRALGSATDTISQAEAASASATNPRSVTENRMTSIEKQHWLLTDMIFFLYHTICTFHVIVPLLYWGYLAYAGDARGMALGIPRDALWRNYSFHGGDLILVLVEFSINTMPFIPSHILIVYLICLLYLGEAFLVYHVDGFWIYPFLDTSIGPLWMAYYVGVGFAIMCAFFLMYFIHRLRDRRPVKKQQQQGQDSALEQTQNQGQDDQGHSAYDMSGSAIDTCPDQEEMNEAYCFDKDDKINGDSQNRTRSCSVSSTNTTATLVGSDEGIRSKDVEKDRSLSRGISRRLSLLGEVPPTIPETAGQSGQVTDQLERLEVLEEGNETENDTSEENRFP